MIIETPLGYLETDIPTVYGRKHQFRSFNGDSFDIPDWVAWLALGVGLIGGGYVGWMGATQLANLSFFKNYATQLLDDITPIGAIREIGKSFKGAVSKRKR